MAINKQNNDNFQLFKRLRRYFSGKTVLIPTKDGDKLKLKSVSGDKTINMAYDRLFTLKNSSGYNSFMNNYSSRVQNKMFLTYEYDLMERDPIISRALTLLAQQSCLTDLQDEMMHINCENERVKASLEHLFYQILNIDTLLPMWTRQMLKYGDCYVYLDLQEGIGVTDAVTLGSGDVERIEDETRGEVTKFVIQNISEDLNEEFILHFRHVLSVEFLPYGVSLLESIRKYWKMMTLLEDFMMVYYLLRSVNQRVFKVDVGAIEPQSVPNFIEQLKILYKKKPLINSDTGDYDMLYDPLSAIEDIILPVRDGYENTTFDEIPASNETNIIEGINLLRQKLMTGLGIPNFILNYEEQLNSRATAGSEDIRFAQTVESIQAIMISELEKVAVTHLILQGFSKKDVLSFTLSLTAPSNLHEAEKLDTLERMTDVASSMLESGFFSRDYLWREIFKLSDSEIETMKKEIQNDKIDDKISEDTVSSIELPDDSEVGTTGEESDNGEDKGLEPASTPDAIQKDAPTGRAEDLMGARKQSSNPPERRNTTTSDLEI